MMTTFNSDQLGMAVFLLIAVLFNIWFIFASARRAFVTQVPGASGTYEARKYRMVTYAVLAMACFDIPWVWLCMIQCWNNTFHSNNVFNQNSGSDSFGCQFMGWYSTFSLVSMMASHCLVVNYLKNVYRPDTRCCTDSKMSFLGLCFLILASSCLFASMPLIQGDGYKLTTGGFCYADFTNTTQSSIILSVVVLLLIMAGCLWIQIRPLVQYWYFIVFFSATWLLWIPATSYGIATGEEIPSPYMILGAIVGHGNAIVNPLLYGVQLFRLMGSTEGNDDKQKSKELMDVEDPKIDIDAANNRRIVG